MLKQYRFVANAPRGPMGWWVLMPIALVSLATLSWTVTGTDTEIGKLVQGLTALDSRLYRPHVASQSKLYH